MTKEELIIKKLIKIAHNQQKILSKLAQANDPNVVYLKDAAQQAAVNSGFNTTTVNVIPLKGSSNPGRIDPTNLVVAAPGYTVTVGGAPQNNQIRQKYLDVLRKQVATQKPDQPDLVKNLSITFSD